MVSGNVHKIGYVFANILSFEILPIQAFRHRHLNKVLNFVLVDFRVATFFLVQHTKTRKNVPNDQKLYQKAIKYM
jgi:hypothetical protein